MSKAIETMHIKCFIANPGGAYDPAPLEDLTHNAVVAPMVGDFLFAAHEPNPKQAYVVKARHFDIGIDETVNRCSLLVETVEQSFPS